MEKPNLLWEIMKYCPGILFSIEATQTSLRTSLCRDISHFHYFLESQFGLKNVRDLDFTSCKSLLQSQLDDLGLLFYMTENEPIRQRGMARGRPKYRSGYVPKLVSFDCHK